METLISMVLVGVILGLVARGYQALNRLNLASYQMSQRLEFMSFLQRLTYEASSALTMTTSPSQIQFQRINPTLNLTRNQPAPTRLPWPIDVPPSTTGLLTAPNLVTTRYQYNAASKEIRRTAFGTTVVAIGDIGEFLAGTEAGGRILWVQVRPENMTAAVRARVLLPVMP